MSNYAVRSATWNKEVSETGRIRLSDCATGAPAHWPDINGFDLEAGVNDDILEDTTNVLLRYKVVMLRSDGCWKMNAKQLALSVTKTVLRR